MQTEATRDKTVLVIDDNIGILKLIERTLAPEGYRILLAADGEHGFELFKANKPSIVLLDVKMPAPDGFAVLNSIKAISKVPVMMISAIWEKESMQKALALGADSYITKPFSPKDVLERIKMRLNSDYLKYLRTKYGVTLPRN